MWVIIISHDVADGNDFVVVEIVVPLASRAAAVEQARNQGWWKHQLDPPDKWIFQIGFLGSLCAEIKEATPPV